MIKSIFDTRHCTAGFTHVERHGFPGITLSPGEANMLSVFIKIVP